MTAIANEVNELAKDCIIEEGSKVTSFSVSDDSNIYPASSTAELSEDASEIDFAKTADVPEELVKIQILHGHGFVWNSGDVKILRKKYRIIGTFVGVLPRKPNQVVMGGLPLQLMDEEISLLFEKKLAKLVDCKFNMISRELVKSKYEEHYEVSYEEQKKAEFEKRKKVIESVADQILAGKRRKLKDRSKDGDVDSGKLTLDDVIAETLQNVVPLTKTKMLVQSHCQFPFPALLPSEEFLWSLPPEGKKRIRYFVFRDLWEQGYTLTDGIKFGVDYLAYHGDPLLYHALFMVRCVEFSSKFSENNVSRWVRVGVHTKKTLALATVNSENNVMYKSLEWLGS